MEGLIEVQGVFVPQDLLDKLGLDFGIAADLMDSFSDKPGDINDLTSDLWTDKTGDVPGEYGLLEWVNSSKDAMVSYEEGVDYIINEWTYVQPNGCVDERVTVIRPQYPGSGSGEIIYSSCDRT